MPVLKTSEYDAWDLPPCDAAGVATGAVLTLVVHLDETWLNDMPFKIACNGTSSKNMTTCNRGSACRSRRAQSESPWQT
ncbi:hypothetical protein AEM42_14150 [Betaproteobacteria bacterium UKL13-2]|jgi:hypothetical protein|nr:hypothetical protein AEM42_14150 [Betaproteobacteria bacterium UKL13-2]